MTKLVAIHCIHVNWDGAKKFTGKYDSEGEPIIRSVTTVIKPKEHFEVPEHKADERARLLELGAARELTPVEVELASLV